MVQTHQHAQTTTSQLIPSTISPAARLAEQGFGPLDDGDREFDLFLSHAIENKDFAWPLAEELKSRGVKVWYDEMVISVGDSLRESIDRGLARSRFGAVIFSKQFFAKRWPSYELNGLVSREIQGRKVILPVWHPELTIQELISYSPTMADKAALVGSKLSITEIADNLAELVLGDSY